MSTLLISLTALISGGGAIAGPWAVYFSIGMLGGGGCRVTKEGTMMKRRMHATGSTAMRYGSRQTKE